MPLLLVPVLIVIFLVPSPFLAIIGITTPTTIFSIALPFRVPTSTAVSITAFVSSVVGATTAFSSFFASTLAVVVVLPGSIFTIVSAAIAIIVIVLISSTVLIFPPFAIVIAISSTVAVAVAVAVISFLSPLFTPSLIVLAVIVVSALASWCLLVRDHALSLKFCLELLFCYNLASVLVPQRNGIIDLRDLLPFAFPTTPFTKLNAYSSLLLCAYAK